MSDSSTWFKQTKSLALIRSETYRLRLLGRLWYANLLFVVLPAIFATSSAILAAGSGGKTLLWLFNAQLAAGLAGVAAILSAIHKSLKCEEYQAECLRLSQEYQSIAILFDSALSRPDEERDSLQQELTKRLEKLTKDAKAPLPDSYINKAKKLIDKVKEKDANYVS
jgi:hypothetical protein